MKVLESLKSNFVTFLRNKKYTTANFKIYPYLCWGGPVGKKKLVCFAGGKAGTGVRPHGRPIATLLMRIFEIIFFFTGGIFFMLVDGPEFTSHDCIAFCWPDTAVSEIPKNGDFRLENLEIPATRRRKRPGKKFCRTNTTPGM